MTTTTAARAVPLLPLAVLVVLVPAVIVGGRSVSTDLAPEPWDDAPPEVDVASERDDLLTRGRAVDAGGLDAGLQAALDAATDAAAADGVDLVVSSGYRSADQQLENLEAEIAERGSTDEALRWVFTPERSMHVRGLAIDLGNGPAADWLQADGARFGLCKTLDWEWWHFEWRQRWQEAGACPAPATTPAGAPAP